MNQTQSHMTQETETLDKDIDRMARERAEIEEQLEERNNELDKIGDFETARCTEFRREGGWAGDSEHLVFIFQFPDGTTGKVPFGTTNEPKSMQRFMKSHGADSVTDMIGATHGCIYTDSGWQLHRKQSPRPSLYYSFVEQHGALTPVYWPSFVVSLAVAYGGLSQYDPNSVWSLVVIIASVLLVAHGIFRTLADKELRVS